MNLRIVPSPRPLTAGEAKMERRRHTNAINAVLGELHERQRHYATSRDLIGAERDELAIRLGVAAAALQTAIRALEDVLIGGALPDGSRGVEVRDGDVQPLKPLGVRGLVGPRREDAPAAAPTYGLDRPDRELVRRNLDHHSHRCAPFDFGGGAA